jgi:hypothetical protein
MLIHGHLARARGAGPGTARKSTTRARSGPTAIVLVPGPVRLAGRACDTALAHNASTARPDKGVGTTAARPCLSLSPSRSAPQPLSSLCRSAPPLSLRNLSLALPLSRRRPALSLCATGPLPSLYAAFAGSTFAPSASPSPPWGHGRSSRLQTEEAPPAERC